jgi:hypothetical protein
MRTARAFAFYTPTLLLLACGNVSQLSTDGGTHIDALREPDSSMHDASRADTSSGSSSGTGTSTSSSSSGSGTSGSSGTGSSGTGSGSDAGMTPPSCMHPIDCIGNGDVCCISPTISTTHGECLSGMACDGLGGARLCSAATKTIACGQEACVSADCGGQTLFVCAGTMLCSFDAGADASADAAGPSSDAGVTDGSLGDAFNAGAGDLDGACNPPEGGLGCTPGTIACADASCSVPTKECCRTGQGDSCQVAGAMCAGMPVSCDEAADCPAPGDICCLVSSGISLSSATTSCQRGPTCPKAAGGTTIADVQVCRSNHECQSGQCQFWSCAGNLIEACGNPVPSDPSLCMLAPQ